MSLVFLSYRRADCPDAVSRLHEKLRAKLRNTEVFYDHSSIELGAEFPQLLRDKVTAADVVLICIGPKWVELLQSRREVHDFVREEVRLALESKKEVIPLLIGGNLHMPTEADLANFPELLPLRSKNAQLIRPDPNFGPDSDKLLAHLEKTMPSEILGTILAGKYKVLRFLGDGGMGEVYQAEQSKPERRDVAIKLIKAGMDSKEILARFETERQALAVMDHPNICKVLDGGLTPTGRPYFAMEYVKGVPITQFCDERKFTPAQRVELFLTVCQAVQHAHQKGIIHRDLKPANVLVEMKDNKPFVKVIDFGLAKALGQKLSELSFAGTEFGKWVGTLEYSSPEQADGRQDIDTLTDVYSLGALLYELLAGSPPFTREELLKSGEAEMRRIIKEDTPSKPSNKLSSSTNLPALAANRQLDPTKLTRALRGDLDWILLKALDKDRSLRYATPTALADDLERHLNNEPITAGKPSLSLRLRKFARRNRAPVIATCMVFAVMVLGITGTSLGFFAAREAEGRAFQNAEYARASSEREKDRAEEAIWEKKNAETQLARAEKMVYVNSIETAQRQWDEGHAGPAFDALETCRKEYRGWEHDYLYSRFNNDCVTLHSSMIKAYSVSFRPDGKHIVTANTDNSLQVWNAVNGQESHKLKGHKNLVTKVTYSPDGMLLASGCFDHLVKIWNAVDGQELICFDGHTNHITDLCFSPDGKQIVTGSADHLAKIWDTVSGRELLCLTGHKGSVNSVSFSPDGKRIVSGSHDGLVKTWDAVNGQELLSLSGHKGWVNSVSFSPDGKRIASSGKDQILRIWDANKGQEILTMLGHESGINCVTFSPDGKQIATGSHDGLVKIWDAVSGKEITTLTGHTDAVTSLSCSQDCKRIASGSSDRNLKIWQMSGRGNQLGSQSKNVSRKNVSFSPDGKLVALENTDNILQVCDANTFEKLLLLNGHKGHITSVSFSLDGKRIVSGSHDGLVKTWDSINGQELLSLSGHTNWVNSVSFSPDGKQIVSGSLDQKVKVWDALTGQEILTIMDHTSTVNCVVFSPDSKQIASGSYNGSVKIWDAKNGHEIVAMKGHTDQVTSLSFSPNGKRIISSSEDKYLMIWDTETGKAQITIKYSPANFRNSLFIFSIDGKRILAEDAKGKIIRWDASFSVNRPEEWETEQKRRLQEWAAWNPNWHNQQAGESEKAEQWFAACFHLRLLVQHAPEDVALANRLQTAVENLKVSPHEKK
jgi:eukaryotic-like serine/threonine-protein kinase